MTTFDYNILPPEPTVEEVMLDPAVTAITEWTPPNTCAPHTEEDDRAILENLDRIAPWIRRITQGVAEELNHA